MIDVSIRNEILNSLKDMPYKLRLILFGSQAHGSADENSDIDLVVIMDKKGKSANYKESIENKKIVSKKLLPLRRRHPIDLLVYTEDEWTDLQNSESSFFKRIEKEGIAIS